MSARVGIVVLNWNGGAQTVAAVESARTQLDREHFIVVVDNCSAQAERHALRRRYDGEERIRLCFLAHNRGYTGGMNAGIDAALADGADMVLLLTQDAALTPGALATMRAAALADARVGIVGPKVVDAQCTSRTLSIGERVHVACLCLPRTLLRYRGARLGAYEVGGVLGCVMLLTRPCIEAIGTFDEELFMYYEEVDLCLRARKAGFKVVCAPQACVLHDGLRGYLAGFAPYSAELKARNLLHLMRRWASPAQWLVLLPSYGLLLAGSMILYGARGRFEVIGGLLRGVAAGVRGRGGLPGSWAAEPAVVADQRSRS